jgi:hypothetical protein
MFPEGKRNFIAAFGAWSYKNPKVIEKYREYERS